MVARLQVRPPTQLALPYGAYRLVHSDGSPVERTDKHPFCMSRVYYEAVERPSEVWAELADGSCRWRQTSSEVKVIALQVRLLPEASPPPCMQALLHQQCSYEGVFPTFKDICKIAPVEW